MLVIVAVSVVSSLVFSVIFALGVAYLRENSHSRRVSRLEAEFDSLRNSVSGRYGNEVKRQKEEALMEFIAQSAQILLDDKNPDKKKALGALLMQHPDVGLGLAKKGLKM